MIGRLSFEVEEALTDDIDNVLELRNQAAVWLSSMGIEQWEVDQLRRTVVGRRVRNGECFVIRLPGEQDLMATLALDFDDQFTWGSRGADGDAGYLHTIVVRPDSAGRSVGRWFIGWAENRILVSGRRFSRLDCAEANPKLRAWYRRLGYKEVGRRDYGDAWFPVALFERDLTAFGRSGE